MARTGKRRRGRPDGARYVATYAKPPMKEDIAWLLYVARECLAGRRLYVDLIEVNPPMIVWVLALPTALSSALGVAADAVDREGDADPPEQQLGFLPAIFQRIRRRLLEPPGELLIGRAEVAPGAVHLIKRNRHRIRTLFAPCATVHDFSRW